MKICCKKSVLEIINMLSSNDDENYDIVSTCCCGIKIGITTNKKEQRNGTKNKD